MMKHSLIPCPVFVPLGCQQEESVQHSPINIPSLSMLHAEKLGNIIDKLGMGLGMRLCATLTVVVATGYKHLLDLMS